MTITTSRKADKHGHEIARAEYRAQKANKAKVKVVSKPKIQHEGQVSEIKKELNKKYGI